MLIILIAFKNSNNNFHKANVELVLQKSPFALAYLVKGNCGLSFPRLYQMRAKQRSIAATALNSMVNMA